MKRNMDLVRGILLDIESNANIHGKYILSDADFGAASGSDRSAIQYHLRLLLDAGYIEGEDLLKSAVAEQKQAVPTTVFSGGSAQRALEVSNSFNAGTSILVTRMTWAGHDFLDTVRDGKIWAQTKDALKGVEGVGIDMLKDVAKKIGKTIINHQVEKHTGIKLDL